MKITSLYILLWFVALPLLAEKLCVFTPIDVTQGLSGNKVRNITQLPDGRMMITTEGQLNLYDGTHFCYLHYNRQHLCPLSDYSGYHHEYIDANGYMWMKNQHQLMMVDMGHECFVEHPDSLLAVWGIDMPIKDFFMDEGQNIWIITEQDALEVIKKETLKAETFMEHVSTVAHEHDVLYDLGVMDSQLYLFYRSGLLVCYDLDSRKEMYRRELADEFPRGVFGNTSYIVAGKHTFYQLCNGNKGGVMLRFDMTKRKWKEMLRTDWRFNYMSLDKDGSMWVSGIEGLWNVSPDGEEIQYIPTLKLVDGQKIETEVSTLYNDNQGGLWVGTLNRGVLYYHPDRFRFQNIGKALFPVSGDANIRVTGFAETSDGQILVETGTGLFCYHPADGELVRFPGQMSVKEPFRELEGEGDVLQTVALNENTLMGITWHSWFLYDRKLKKRETFPTLHPCCAIYVDAQQRVWVGQEDGLLLWDMRSGERRMFYTADGLGNNSIRSITQTKDGRIWFSTAGGITSLTVHEGEYSFINYNQYDGVITDEFCERSVFVSSDGTIYWGGLNGFNRLLPSLVMQDQTYSLPLFVDFNLFGERVETGKSYHGNVILKQPLTQTQEIVLDYNQNFFTLGFSALNYINPTQTYYRFQLQGIDPTEQEIRSSDGKGYVTYTDLPSGNYVFKVQAAGNGKTWSGQYAVLKIKVKAPFWKTPYAYAVYMLILMAVAFVAMHTYWRRKRRNLVREQKEKLDEMKTVFLQNIHHELEVPVERIISPLDSMLKYMDEGRSKSQLQTIRQEAVGLKELVGDLSEGVLLPLPFDESALNLEDLLVNMRQLLEQQERRKGQSEHDTEQNAIETLLTAADEAFVRKALEYVEKNIDNSEYSVEVLSRDMGMDRTGLYRKLVAVAGKTPTNFIRSIRLRRAAQLLDEGYTVAEVADSVGFSTSSYLSKCFQEEFGMKPSQYVNRQKKR